MATEELRVLVLGGYGAVGALIADRVIADGGRAVRAGRDPARADQVVDLREPGLESYRRALDGMAVVVNASGLEDPALVTVAAEKGVAFVDITATNKYMTAIEQLDVRAPVVLSVGLAPGLTTLLAAALHADGPAAIDIALLVGTGDAHGVAATAWTFGLLGKRFAEPSTGAVVRNFGGPQVFDLPTYGRRRLYRADFSDQHVLTRDLGAAVRFFLGFTSRTATNGLAAISWIPGASRLPTGQHLPGSDAWLAFAVTTDGRTKWAAGRNQSHATAVVAAVTAFAAAKLQPGVHHLHQVMSMDQLPNSLLRRG
jgi:saccharopine dehydrogenase-like NADP-dependent oxidoreductase